MHSTYLSSDKQRSIVEEKANESSNKVPLNKGHCAGRVLRRIIRLEQRANAFTFCTFPCPACQPLPIASARGRNLKR